MQWRGWIYFIFVFVHWFGVENLQCNCLVLFVCLLFVFCFFLSVGNFTKVKLLALPQFRVAKDDRYHITHVVVFPHDFIEKLTPWPICNPLNEIQFNNFHKEYKKSEANSLFYYGFDGVQNWQTDGGCVMIPKCPMPTCERYGCVEHLEQVKKERREPSETRMHHTCGYNKQTHVALLSSQQGIVHKWLKTQALDETKNVINQEQLIDDVMNQVARSEME